MATITYGGFRYSVSQEIALKAMRTARRAGKSNGHGTIVFEYEGQKECLLIGPGIPFAVTVDDDLDKEGIMALLGKKNGIGVEPLSADSPLEEYFFTS